MRKYSIFFVILCSLVVIIQTNYEENEFLSEAKSVVPSLRYKTKGEAGKICIIGGSIEYTGAPYFSAITALKVGADLVYVITTESAAQVIKSYSPELIVYPYLNIESLPKVMNLLVKMDSIIIGPGLGRENDTLKLTYEIIQVCKTLMKPLVIDADGLYAISKNVSVLMDYPEPGVILTPNEREAKKLMEASTNDTNWYKYWGNNVSILAKGYEDCYYSNEDTLFWIVASGGSDRRSGGQGDVLSGALGTFYNWALKTKSLNKQSTSFHSCKLTAIARSISSYAASVFTRKCNEYAFETFGRSMTATDMISKIHVTFEYLFEN